MKIITRLNFFINFYKIMLIKIHEVFYCHNKVKGDKNHNCNNNNNSNNNFINEDNICFNVDSPNDVINLQSICQ
jgi:hypothetical protein